MIIHVLGLIGHITILFMGFINQLTKLYIYIYLGGLTKCKATVMDMTKVGTET